MAQTTVTNYFATRKRSATEDTNVKWGKKVLVLDVDNKQTIASDGTRLDNDSDNSNVKILSIRGSSKVTLSTKPVNTPKNRKIKDSSKNGNIESLFNNMGKNESEILSSDEANITSDTEKHHTPVKLPAVVEEVHITPSVTHGVQQPSAPTKKPSAMDKVNVSGGEPTLAELKRKMSRSSRLAELKASLSRFKQSEKELAIAEKNTQHIKESLNLKSFKSIEVEVYVSPVKPQTPEKAYLSPKKESPVCRRNLFSSQSPSKTSILTTSGFSKPISETVKASLSLPYKYRHIAEIFRAMDTISQILYNRKEVITFKKLKPAIEEMMKRNLLEKHLAQILFVYPEAYNFEIQKLREYGTGTKQENWELVLTPNISEQSITVEKLLERRRNLFKILLEKVKDYHQEFLTTLIPPMKVSRNNITRWHPLFDLEKVPDLELAALPQAPKEETLTTGSQVLEKARDLFKCNTKMERALEKLKEFRANQTSTPAEDTNQKPSSVLKGIPQALLEKVRQKQAAKAFQSMTRSVVKDKEAELYSRLPEIARLSRNVFVSERKNVLPLDLVIDKLSISYKIHLSRTNLEEHLRVIAKEAGHWLKFEEVRGGVFVRLFKNEDLSLVLSRLEALAQQKMT